MVEVQVSFQVVRVGRHDYVFVPKLRAMCLLGRDAEWVSISCQFQWRNVRTDGDGIPPNQDYNAAAIEAIAKAPASPQKRIKRKVGYPDGGEGQDGAVRPPERAMKCLCLDDDSEEDGSHADDTMRR